MRSPVRFAIALIALSVAMPKLATAEVVGSGTSASCTEAALDAALAGSGVVTFDCGGPATVTIGRTKFIAHDTTIDGNGRITISGGNVVSIFVVDADATLSLVGLTLTGGFSGAEPGGGIRNFGTLIMNGCTVAANYTSSFGGGLANEGAATVTDSTFLDNIAGTGGGGIANFRTLKILRSTIFRNIAGDPGAGTGGGLENFGTLTVANSTFSSNTVTFDPVGVPGLGGGLDNEGAATIANCTFSRNAAPYGGYPGGVRNNGTLVVKNTLIAISIDGDCSNEGFGHTIEGTNNLAEGPCAPSFQQIRAVDLQLAGLADNGGATLTIAIWPGSAAIDRGDTSTCSDPTMVGGVDQRGMPRFEPGDAHCDIGAFELPFSVASVKPTPAATFLALNGEPSIYFGNNLHVALTPDDGTFSATHSFGHVNVTFFHNGGGFWMLDFVAPSGSELHPGEYDNVTSYAYPQDGLPGFGITDGGGCSIGITGRYAVREGVYDIDGTVERFAADFEQHCYGEPPALFGSVRLNSNVPTASPGTATPPPTPLPTCHGDCNGDAAVTVDELLTTINIALENTNLSACGSADENGDGQVTVDEIMAAVTAALQACGPTP